MSVIASFYQVDRAGLDAAVAAGHDDVDLFLEEETKIPDVFDWSGYAMLSTMEYLAKHHGLVETHTWLGPDGASIFIFGTEHQRFVPTLNPDLFDEDELREALRAFGLDSEEAGMAALDVITALRDQIAALTANRALAVYVG